MESEGQGEEKVGENDLDLLSEGLENCVVFPKEGDATNEDGEFDGECEWVEEEVADEENAQGDEDGTQEKNGSVELKGLFTF